MLFLDLVDKLNTHECDSHIIKALKAESQSPTLFHSTLVLFKELIDIFVRPHCELGWQYVFVSKLRHRFMGGDIPLQSALLRPATPLDRLRKKRLAAALLRCSLKEKSTMSPARSTAR